MRHGGSQSACRGVTALDCDQRRQAKHGAHDQIIAGRQRIAGLRDQPGRDQRRQAAEDRHRDAVTERHADRPCVDRN